MDTALKVVMAAVLLTMIGALMFIMLSDKAGIFGKTSNDQIENSECSLAQSRFEAACDCSGNSLDEEGGEMTTDKAHRIWENKPSGCTFGSSNDRYYCSDACG